ncbi:transcription factor LHW-like [Durio zibethinus]|uniref:Transcription factor LHW-like n=1 Tax=Durio zibethinus TaxID=66656 RepID=A0A6P5ZUA5_DURZI|nr:transcription factor LHW-like [Durio zibethinus]
MGGLLKEALKSLCRVSQWSYAVFWKIGCQNTNLLIWEECYYEPALSSIPPCITGLQNPEFSFGEWEGCWGSEISSQLGSQPWDKVHFLINKMMMNNRISVVGQGLVGRAAFTGNHQWILANNYITDAHPLEVLHEVRLQFSAGMQTVSVIPVLPHGVLQLGSSTTIVENMGFVNDVKSLILRLGCISGALLSNSYGTNECIEKIGIPISLAKPISMDSAGIFRSINSITSVAEGCNQQSNPSQASRVIGQSSSLIKQIQENSQGTASTSQLPGMTQTMAKSHDGHCESKISPEMKSNQNFKSLMDCGVVGAEVIPSNQTLWLDPQVGFCNSRSGFNCQPIIVESNASHSSIKSMEQQILLDTGLRSHVINSTSASNSQMKSKSVPGIVPNLQKLEDVTSSCRQLAGSGVQIVGSSRVEVPLSILANQLTSTCMPSGVANQGHDFEDSKCTQADLVPKKESIDNDLFQALSIPLLHADEGTPFSEELSSAIYDCLQHESESLSTRSLNVKYEDTCIQPPSGDDLFDVLGADLKTKLLNGKRNNVLAEGPDLKMQNPGNDTSIFKDMLNVFSDIFSANEGISDQGIYSGMGSDHLLDAVVSSAQSAAKQISDDDVSCRTTLTKFSNSSVPSSSPTFGQVNISNQVQGELLGGLPKSLLKGGTLPSSSYRSGCSKDDAGTCSQTTSMYGSQISSWVEQGHNSRRDSSVSTAYSKRNDEMTKPNRKRLKPGENPRPRPKDRQMIQDRVKELREIVPNGAKCSIDALLEKTIKHMLFLQSVTKHADKLKQTGESKIKENFEGGATWAFEVGSQSRICPIVVEDLNPPRQMLVEMLCEERGFFLEIADLIRGLGLTILKGVMETRNDKIWARFAVEANRDVTRVEIFMSLVHLLEQTVKGSTSSANAFDSNNMMVQHSFPQAASIPATGRASSLQ